MGWERGGGGRGSVGRVLRGGGGEVEMWSTWFVL